MAMIRMNRPSLMLYGGTIASGRSCKGEDLDIVSTFEAYGKFIAGTISDEEMKSSCGVLRHTHLYGWRLASNIYMYDKEIHRL